MKIILKNKDGAVLHTAKKYCEEDISVGIETQEVVITPSKEEQVQEGLLSKVTVQGVTASVDENIKSENIKLGTTILGVEGGYEGIDTSDATALSEDILQDKTAYVNNEKITGTMQEYDGGYTGNGETGNEWEENFISSIDNSLGARITRLPDKLTSVGQYAFYKSKIAITELPNKITSIEKSAFEDCIYLLISKLPDTIKTLSSNCFKNCSKITISELPIGLTSIPESCFHGCSNVSVSRVPDGVTFIGSSAFRGCNEITSFELPSSITTINNNVFYNCNRMTTFKALGDITSFGSYVFNGATALERVELPNITSVPKLGNNQVFYNTLIANGKGYIYVPDNLVEEIKTATYWSTLANQIKPISELEV